MVKGSSVPVAEISLLIVSSTSSSEILTWTHGSPMVSESSSAASTSKDPSDPHVYSVTDSA